MLAVLVLTLAGGIAHASNRPAAAAVPIQQSAAMQQMRAELPAQTRQRHDAMHEQMQQTAGQMSGGGMMSGGYQASAQR